MNEMMLVGKTELSELESLVREITEVKLVGECCKLFIANQDYIDQYRFIGRSYKMNKRNGKHYAHSFTQKCRLRNEIVDFSEKES